MKATRSAGQAVALALIVAASCGRSELLDDLEVPGGLDASTSIDGAPQDRAVTDVGRDAGAIDSTAPDAGDGGSDGEASVSADTGAPSTDAASTDAADAEAGPDGCTATVSATPGAVSWESIATSGPGWGIGVTVIDAARGPGGTTAIVGVYGGPVTLGPFTLPSPLDMDGEYVQQAFVAEVDSAGQYVFATAFQNVNGPSGSYYDDRQYAEGVTFDAAGNLYVVGGFTGVIQFPGSPPGVLATGYQRPPGTFDFGPAFAFVTELDPKGKHVWSRSFGNLGSNPAVSVGTLGIAVTLEPGGDLVVAGQTGGAIDFAGGDAGAGGPFAFDFPDATSRPFVLRLTPAGDPVWARMFYVPQYGDVRDITVDATGNVFVAGTFGGGTLGGTLGFVGGGVDAGTVLSCALDAGCGQTGYVAEVDPAGRLAWAHAAAEFPGTGSPQGSSGFTGIAVDGQGNASAIGWAFETALDREAGTWTYPVGGLLVTSFDPGGATRWSVTAGGGGAFGVAGVACDALGDVFVTGAAAGNMTFPDGYDAGGVDGSATYIVGRLHPDGSTAWALSSGTPWGPPLIDRCPTQLVVAGLGTNGGIDGGPQTVMLAEALAP